MIHDQNSKGKMIIYDLLKNEMSLFNADLIDILESLEVFLAHSERMVGFIDRSIHQSRTGGG